MSESRLRRPKRAGKSPPVPIEPPRSETAEVEHPIATLSGLFQDDPLWDEFVQAMKRARFEEDAKEDVSGRDERD
jgi:hypothetical protein